MPRVAAAALRARGGRRIPAELWDAAAQAKQVREDAGVEARALVEDARVEAERLRAAAAERGRDEGLAAAAEAIGRAAVERDRLLASSEAEIIELAFAIASRVLARAVERDREAVVEVASRALEMARDRVDVTLRVHPDDLAALREAETGLLEGMSRARRIVIAEDAAVGRGGAVVQTESVSIDARLAVQLEGLRRAIETYEP